MDEDPAPDAADVAAFELRRGLRIPEPLRSAICVANGARVIDGHLPEWILTQLIPFHSGRGGIEWTYELFVGHQRITPASFLPFGVTAFGDTYFADCSDGGAVRLWDHEERVMHRLSRNMTEFWTQLGNGK